MKIEYPLKYKHFVGVKFISGDPESGNRIKLDPKDFNELQDIWLQHIDSFVRAVRGHDIGILEGCEVSVQRQAGVAGAVPTYELVVTPGYVYVNSALIRVVQNHVFTIPTTRNWSGFKSHYLILKPDIREFSGGFGEPGHSALAGRLTSHRMEIGFSIELVTELPSQPAINAPLYTEEIVTASQEELARKHNMPWFVVLAEVKIRDLISELDQDVIVDVSNVSRLKVMSEIQEIAVTALEKIQNHLKTFFFKRELVGEVDANNKVFGFPVEFNILPGSEQYLEVFNNNALVEPSQYTIKSGTSDWVTGEQHFNSYYVEFVDAPLVGSIITASYFVDHHPQYLSNMRFLEHLSPNSGDHDHRYYTETEEDDWREEHNSSIESHPTHVTHNFFDEWVGNHTGAETIDHDNVYTRIGHAHFISDTLELQDDLTELSQGIGYGNDDHYIVSQEIFEGVDGANRIFQLHSELLEDGIGYIKQVRADVSHDAVNNPAVLDVIDASEDFDAQAGAFSAAKQLSVQNYNRRPSSVIQSDDEVWSFWASTNFSNNTSEIWFASYKQGDGFFSPATPTSLACNENSRVSATVVYSLVPSINQRIVLVWHYDGALRYTYIEEGQTDWTSFVTQIPGSAGCLDPAIIWVNDGSTLGRLHLTYRKQAPSGKWAIYRRVFEIDLTEYGTEMLLSDDTDDHYSPIILQDKSATKRIWHGWMRHTGDRDNPDHDNSLIFEAKIMDKLTDAIYVPTFNVGNIQGLNVASTISWAAESDGIWAQFSSLLGTTFELFYQKFDMNGGGVGDGTKFVDAQNHAISVASDGDVWIFYDYLGTIYYRAQQRGAGQVKWNKALKYIEFQLPPVNGSAIYVDIAIPIKSLNSRVSSLESKRADDEEALAIKINAAIESLGLGFPLERLASLREKLIVEADIETDNRRQVYGYDHVFYDKLFISHNNEANRPAGMAQLVSKDGSWTTFENSGLEYDDMGKVANNTGKIIKIYSTVRSLPDFFTDGHLRLEIHGEPNLECVEARITSNMDPSPFSSSITWLSVNKSNYFKDIDLTANQAFTDNNDFGLEITLLPGGFIYDWALFFKKKVI